MRLLAWCDSVRVDILRSNLELNTDRVEGRVGLKRWPRNTIVIKQKANSKNNMRGVYHTPKGIGHGNMGYTLRARLHVHMKHALVSASGNVFSCIFHSIYT